MKGNVTEEIALYSKSVSISKKEVMVLKQRGFPLFNSFLVSTGKLRDSTQNRCSKMKGL